MSFVINPYAFGLRQFWTDLSSTAGKVITGFSSTFTNTVTVNWGDGSTTPLSSGVSVNKTLGTTNAIALETGNAVVTAIDCGASLSTLGGSINLFGFPSLQQFRCNFNNISAISGYSNNTNLSVLQLFGNKLTGSLPDISTNTNLVECRLSANLFTGSIPALNSPLLRIYNCDTNPLTGSIPSLNNLPQIRTFYCYSNNLTGSIPSTSSNVFLQDFQCYRNNLTGSIPNLSVNTNLFVYGCQENQLTGNIPNLSANTLLRDFRCNGNSLSGFSGGSVSNTLGVFRAENNQLTSSAVNAILASFVAAGRTSANGTCQLFLGGTGNAAPTGQGITDKATLQSRGWTVQTN